MRATYGRASLALLAALLLLPAFAAAEGEAGTIGATIEIKQAAVTASLYGASSDVRVAVLATVHISTERGHFVNLQLSVVGTLWPSEMSQTTIRTQTATDVPVSVYIDVPTSAAEGVYELALRGVDGDDIFPITAETPFTVSVFRGPLALYAIGDGVAPPPGATTRWELRLLNLGSADLDFDVEVTVPATFGLTVQNPPVQIVGAGRNETVVVTLRVPASAPAGDYAWSVSVTSGSHPEASTSISVPFEVAAVVVPPTPGKPDFLAQYWLPITLGMVVVGVVAYLSLTEIGYLALSFWVLVPMFTRIRHEKVLDNFTRGQIFGYIQANPGAHYSAIQQVLDIENGVLAYHLRVLMREEFVVARNEGVFKRFYPRDYKIPKGRTLLTRLQVDILETLEKTPGLTQREVARALDESKQVISYNVGILRDAGLIVSERRGGDTVLRAADGASSRLGRDDESFPGAASPSDFSPQ